MARQRGGFLPWLIHKGLRKATSPSFVRRIGAAKQKGGLLPLLMANVIRRKTRESFKRRRAREDRLLQEGAGSGKKRRKRKNRRQKGGWGFGGLGAARPFWADWR